MSARSMTGYARARRSGEPGDLTLTMKGVNHRSLDLHFYLPPELDPFENSLRQAIKARTSRGHIDVRISFQPAHAAAAPALNRALFEAYLKACQEATSLYGIAGQPDLNNALRIPGMLSPARDEAASPELEGELIALLNEALDIFDRFRAREGAAIVAVLKGLTDTIQAHAAEIESLRSEVQPVLQNRLCERLEELLKGVNLEPQRLAQETAMLADRSDISEETARLKVHARELAAILERGGEMGKKLDFLLQEMNRETNTILSKTSGAGDLGLRITALGLEVKSSIEKIREQSLNLE